ncbi:hypothetical protein Poly51_35140 [Rubripirellula tenax]|uniref:Uncharacterized protein n=1 Tax=Rubripirellula tenax TaxID=2528015 RepID=A0A5C6F164_9BACT|nr:hypothetical protein [Rubripirellula tenax]TWU54795.1 hypothetical protein Poly51_35140 [Rubripirellula tenax]
MGILRHPDYPKFDCRLSQKANTKRATFTFALSSLIAQAVESIEATGIPSVDRPPEGKVKRIYTLTCLTLDDGRKVFDLFRDHLAGFPGFVGKLMFEVTTRHLRNPDDADVLPIMLSDDVAAFLSEYGAKKKTPSRTMAGG